jgi:Phytanoyl-CoA dioxygenase (PhyH)
MSGLLHRLFQSPARRHYEQQGYHLFRRAFPAEGIGAIADMTRRLVPSYTGPLRRQDGAFAANTFFPGTTLVSNPLLHPHLSLPGELAALSAALRTLITSGALGERLHALDGVRHYIVHQCLLFIAAQTTELHLDSWSVDTAPLGHSHTVWIPLQDLDHRSGIPCVVPWPAGKVVTEHDLGLTREDAMSRDDRYERYHQALRTKVMSGGPEIVTSLMRKGDFMVWSSLTPHLTLPAQSFPSERLSLQVLIRPADQRWGDFLEQPYDRTSLQLEQVSKFFSVRVMD